MCYCAKPVITVVLASVCAAVKMCSNVRATLLLVIALAVRATSSDDVTLSPRVAAALANASLGRTDIDTVLEAWSVFAQRAPIWANKWVTTVARPQLQATLNKTSISSDCAQSLFATLHAVQNLEEWAIKRE